MEVKKIIENFKQNNKILQKESIIEARNCKEEVVEELLKELEKIANNIDYYANEESPFVLYALYLLAEFREKRAFPILIKLITQDQKMVDYLLGDLVTEDLRKILASTFDGNVESLYNIIGNLKLNQYIRSACFNTLSILQNYDIIKKEQVMNKIEEMLQNELKEDDSIIITEIVSYIAENKLYEKIGLVRKLYNSHRINRYIIGGYDDFIDEIYGEIKYPDEKNMIDDTIDALSRWAFFKEEKKNKKEFKNKSKKNDGFKELMNALNPPLLTKKEKIGRNDPCPCGSGKKYKKCCINKEDNDHVITPADAYIEKSLKKYPKKELQKFYDSETVSIDEKLYKALKHKSIPIFIDRNLAEEARRDLKNMEEAIELIIKKCKKEKINTLEEYDNKIAIHYNFKEMMYGYINILNNEANPKYNKCQEKMIEFFILMIEMFELDEITKKICVNNIINAYIESRSYLKAKNTLEIFKSKLPEMEKYLNKMLSRIYLDEGKSIEETLEPIEDSIKKFGMDEELQKDKISIYYEYVESDYYEDEENEIQIYQKLWDLVKEFIKNNNIKTEEEYDNKVSNSCCYYNIISKIDEFYDYSDNKEAGIDEKLQFLNEAMDLINLERDSKDILIRSLSEIYCEKENEEKAVELLDNYIKESPNNSYAYLTKSNIYTHKENTEYEKAIKVLEEALKNDKLDHKYTLYSKLALLYDECGNEKEACKYQELAIKSDSEIY